MFHQHHGESLFEAWTRFEDLLQKVPRHGIDLWLQIQIFYDHVNPATRRTIDQSASGKLCDKNAKESWALLEDLALYDNESWNDPRDFTKLVKAISLPQDVSSTSDCRLIELKNQLQRLMEAYLAPKLPIQVNKIASSCKICSGPHDTQYCMENLEQAFVEYASSRTDEAGGEQNRNSSSPKRVHFINTITILSKENEHRETGIVKPDTKDNSHDTIIKVKEESKESKEEGNEEKDDPEYIITNPSSPPNLSLSFITKKNDGDIMFVKIIKQYDDFIKEELEEDESDVTGELGIEYFDRFPSRSELTYHKYLMYAPIPSLFLRNPIIIGGCPSNLKIPCNLWHVHIEKAYIDLNSPINVMTRMQYNWIVRKQLEPKEDPEGIRGISNFTWRIIRMHIFVGNFTYVSDFMIVEDISSIIDPRLSQVVLQRPFVEIYNMTHDLSLGIVRFANGTDDIAYKMPHKIEQFNSLSDLEKENTKSVYFRNEEDKRRGVENVMNKILGFYKECLELGPEYLTGLEEGEVDEKKLWCS
ncbi:hypothetical protein Tco_1449309 [Tanacetum coccineum]